jgi:hypothetical protein
MGHAFGLALVTLIGVTFLLAAVQSAWRGAQAPGGPSWVRIGFATLVFYGGIGFFGQGLAALGGLWFVSPTVEWPVGVPDDVTIDSQGRRVVTLTACGRIQIYAGDGTFVRGWFVDASGGTFTARITEADGIEVRTARGRKRLLYSPTGELLEQGSDQGDYPDAHPGPSDRSTFHTPLLLWPFAHPLVAWGVAAVGMAGLALAHKRGPRAA